MTDVNMTLEESIALAEKLQKGYAKLESIERDIASKRDKACRTAFFFILPSPLDFCPL